MQSWRQSVLVDIPGVTDRSPAAPALPDPATPTVAAPAVEVRSDPRITRVDDPTHGTLYAATDLFGAAMATDTAELLALLDDARAQHRPTRAHRTRTEDDSRRPGGHP